MTIKQIIVLIIAFALIFIGFMFVGGCEHTHDKCWNDPENQITESCFTTPKAKWWWKK